MKRTVKTIRTACWHSAVPLGELVPVSLVFFLSFSLKMVQFQHFQTGLCCGAQPLSSTFLFVYVEVDGVPKIGPTLKRIAFRHVGRGEVAPPRFWPRPYCSPPQIFGPTYNSPLQIFRPCNMPVI